MLSVGMREPERGCGRMRPAGDGVGARRAEVERSRKRSLTDAFWCAESVSASGNVRAMERARHQRSPPGSRQGQILLPRAMNEMKGAAQPGSHHAAGCAAPKGGEGARRALAKA